VGPAFTAAYGVSSLRSNSATVEIQNSRPNMGPAMIRYRRATRHASFPGRIPRAR